MANTILNALLIPVHAQDAFERIILQGDETKSIDLDCISPFSLFGDDADVVKLWGVDKHPVIKAVKPYSTTKGEAATHVAYYFDTKWQAINYPLIEKAALLIESNLWYYHFDVGQELYSVLDFQFTKELDGHGEFDYVAYDDVATCLDDICFFFFGKTHDEYIFGEDHVE